MRQANAVGPTSIEGSFSLVTDRIVYMYLLSYLLTIIWVFLRQRVLLYSRVRFWDC